MAGPAPCLRFKLSLVLGRFETGLERKTPRDLKAIAPPGGFLERQREKVPGRRVPSGRQWSKMQQTLGRSVDPCRPTSLPKRHEDDAEPDEST